MRRKHRAGGCWRSTELLMTALRRSWSEIFPCTGQGAAQIVFRITMVARKIGTAQAQNFPDLSWGGVLGEQFSGQPEIDDAPIGLREALQNTPTLNPTLIHNRSALWRDAAAVWCRAELLGCGNRRSCRSQRQRLLSGGEHFLGGGGQDWFRLDDVDRRRETGEFASRRFEVAEAGQTTQVAPIGAGPIAVVALSQKPAQIRGQCRLQRRGADPNPSLEVARASLEHDTGLMPMDAHLLEHLRTGMIQVEEDVTRIAAIGVRPEEDVEASVVVCAQKTHHGVACQLLRGPQPLSRSWFTADGMDQADQINLIRHRRQLATDSLPGEKFAVEHGAEHEPGARFSTMGFQWMVTSALTSCLIAGDHPILSLISFILSINTHKAVGVGVWLNEKGIVLME